MPGSLKRHEAFAAASPIRLSHQALVSLGEQSLNSQHELYFVCRAKQKIYAEKWAALLTQSRPDITELVFVADKLSWYQQRLREADMQKARQELIAELNRTNPFIFLVNPLIYCRLLFLTKNEHFLKEFAEIDITPAKDAFRYLSTFSPTQEKQWEEARAKAAELKPRPLPSRFFANQLPRSKSTGDLTASLRKP